MVYKLYLDEALKKKQRTAIHTDRAMARRALCKSPEIKKTNQMINHQLNTSSNRTALLVSKDTAKMTTARILSVDRFLKGGQE